mgnify:CR=1 FL=1
MNDDSKFWLGFWLLAGLTISSVTWSISWYCVAIARTAMENGYEQGAVPGSAGTHWIKSRSSSNVDKSALPKLPEAQEEAR